jgi:hypothetical protein
MESPVSARPGRRQGRRRLGNESRSASGKEHGRVRPTSAPNLVTGCGRRGRVRSGASGRGRTRGRVAAAVTRVSQPAARVLHHDRHVRLEHARVVRRSRDGLGVPQVVEPEVKRSSRRHRHAVRARGLPVGEEHRDRDVRVGLAGVQETRRLVALQRAPAPPRAFGRDPALRDRPGRPSDRARHPQPPHARARTTRRSTALPRRIPARGRGGGGSARPACSPRGR